MITESDSFTNIDLGAYCAILPMIFVCISYKEAGISFLDVPQFFFSTLEQILTF